MSSKRKRGEVGEVVLPLRKRYRARAYARPAGPLLPSGAFFSRSYRGRRATKDSELKFFDTAVSFLVDATAEIPVSGQLALIPQGVTESTRVGRKCVLKSCTFHGTAFLVPAAAATSAGVITMCLVQDRQANGAAAGFTDIFVGTDANNALRNLSNSSRFRILKRWKIAFNSEAGATTAYNNLAMPLDYYAEVNIPMEFSSTTGAITEIKSNNLFLTAGSSSGIDDLVTISGNFRVRFSDG